MGVGVEGHADELAQEYADPFEGLALEHTGEPTPQRISRRRDRVPFAKLGPAVIDELSPPANEQLVDVEPEEYYLNPGYDGEGLRVPADLDQSLSHYLQLESIHRA